MHQILGLSFEFVLLDATKFKKRLWSCSVKTDVTKIFAGLENKVD